MSLDSEFGENEKLRNCEIKDADHVGEQFAPKGPWVVLIKKALNAWAAKQTPPVAALPLNDFFDSATGDMVALYKTQHSPPILNYANQIDRIVGKKTVAALDKELPARPSPDMKLIMDADKRRLDALAEAERQLVRLKALYEPDVADSDEPAVQALQRQLFVKSGQQFLAHREQLFSLDKAEQIGLGAVQDRQERPSLRPCRSNERSRPGHHFLRQFLCFKDQ